MSFHAGQSFTFGETPSATKWNYLWENDYALQDWTAFTNDTFPIALIQDGDITADKLDADAIGHGYVEIGRTTLGSNGSTISVQNLPSFKYLLIIMDLIATGGAIDAQCTFNNDTGNNYTHRFANDQAADTTTTSAANFNMKSSAATSAFIQLEVLNVAAREKLFRAYGNSGSASGAGNAVTRREMAGKWANTSAAISRFDVSESGAGSFAAGSEVLIFGKN